MLMSIMFIIMLLMMTKMMVSVTRTTATIFFISRRLHSPVGGLTRFKKGKNTPRNVHFKIIQLII